MKLLNHLCLPLLSCILPRVVTNAVYFKGKWQYPFEPYKTSTESFHALSKDSPTKTNKVQVLMMEQTFSSRQNVSLAQVPGKYTAVRLPYEGSGGFAAVFVLPDQSYKSIGEAAGSITGAMVLDPKAWAPLSQDLELSLPRFKVEARLPLTQVSDSWQSKQHRLYVPVQTVRGGVAISL